MKKLYLIGNGFHIHHEIASKYSDFKKWLYKSECLSISNDDSLI